MNNSILVATWDNGLFEITTGGCRHEHAGVSVRGLTTDEQGGALAILNSHTLWQRSGGGEWRTIATVEQELACAVVGPQFILVGTDDASLLAVDAGDNVEPLRAFELTPGRETWFAGSAVVNGEVLGPPLGVRSLCISPNGKTILANVHVGGIPRSVDGGRTWEPTIDILRDVHEVRFHPKNSTISAAATACGLALSCDGGMNWELEQEGLHAAYCSAVAFSEDDVLVAASTDHFADRGAIYRRNNQARGKLTKVSSGLPEWTDGIVDTGCIAARGSTTAVADRSGNLSVSTDGGHVFRRWASVLGQPSCVLIL